MTAIVIEARTRIGRSPPSNSRLNAVDRRHLARVLLLDGGMQPVRIGESRHLPRFSRLSESVPICFG
jgi:hypothetical protein